MVFPGDIPVDGKMTDRTPLPDIPIAIPRIWPLRRVSLIGKHSIAMQSTSVDSASSSWIDEVMILDF